MPKKNKGQFNSKTGKAARKKRRTAAHTDAGRRDKLKAACWWALHNKLNAKPPTELHRFMQEARKKDPHAFMREAKSMFPEAKEDAIEEADEAAYGNHIAMIQNVIDDYKKSKSIPNDGMKAALDGTVLPGSSQVVPRQSGLSHSNGPALSGGPGHSAGDVAYF
jgi:hypothetical protein